MCNHVVAHADRPPRSRPPRRARARLGADHGPRRARGLARRRRRARARGGRAGGRGGGGRGAGAGGGGGGGAARGRRRGGRRGPPDRLHVGRAALARDLDARPRPRGHPLRGHGAHGRPRGGPAHGGAGLTRLPVPGLSEPELGAVFAALADPTRRQVVRSLAREHAVTASGLAGELPMTRQAVATPLSALERAGLVAPRREGRETRYRLTPEPLEEAIAWMADVGARWDRSLEPLRQPARRA